MNNEFLQHFAEPYHKMGENSLIPTKLSNEFLLHFLYLNNEFQHHFAETYQKMGANKVIPTKFKFSWKH